MLTVKQVANHFGLRPDTIRRKARAGEISCIRIGRAYRFDWPDVWSCEDGPMPKGAMSARYQVPLVSKKQIAWSLQVSVRTVDRWLDEGLATRNVFGAVRCNPDDVADWLRLGKEVTLSPDWWQ
ncbi:helix-turn-helix domain-containing protein [Thioclava sp.]|uniref:helix-turn-helix domain-containing protein n=1 Tax=Thioclava sp. TaxID=1933450 RepID=UPI003AA9561E